MPETEMAPAPTLAPSTPFSAALDKAFAEMPKEETTELKTKDEPVPKKEPVKEPAKAEPAKKSETPRELFKKPPEQPKAEPAAAANKSAFDEIAEPTFKDEKGKKGWEAIKSEGKRWETEAQQAASKLKEYESKLGELDTLRTALAERDKQIQEQSELVARVRLQDHPDFKREFGDGHTNLVKRAQKIIGETGGDTAAVEAALAKSGKARIDALSELTDGMNTIQAGRFGRVLDEISDLEERRDTKLAEAKKSYEAMQAEQRTREASQSVKTLQERRAAFEEISTRLRGELEVLQSADGFDEWNARASKIIKDSQAYAEQHPEADIEAEIRARAASAYRDLFLEADARVEERDKKIAELEAELKDIHSKSPSLASRGNGADMGRSPRPFSSAIAESLGGA